MLEETEVRCHGTNPGNGREKLFPRFREIYRVAVRGIIFIDGKLLLIEGKSGEVKLPGGGIDPGEDDYAALVREVKEETWV